MSLAYVRLYFPSSTRHGRPIRARSARLVALENQLTAETGGYTTTPGRGGYRMADGTQMHESVDVVEFFALYEYAIYVAARLARELDQESVLLVVDGAAEFVSQPTEEVPDVARVASL